MQVLFWGANLAGISAHLTRTPAHQKQDETELIVALRGYNESASIVLSGLFLSLLFKVWGL